MSTEGLDIPMTDEQRFIFDLKGWICIPSVLTKNETESIRQHIIDLKNNAESIDPLDRYTLAGPAQILLDHPVVVGVLREILDNDRNDDCYGFRCENSFSIIRKKDQTGPSPHGGHWHGPHGYRVYRDRIYSGLTRVVWELNPVQPGDGATAFISGTHKMNFSLPEIHTQHDSSLLETYSCPAGSVVIFTENTTHAGMTWNSDTHDRVAILNCYNAGLVQYHKMNLPYSVVAKMPPKRQTLFRGVWQHDFTNQKPNNFFSQENMAL
ncbi:hypothetical protein CMK19_09090 [Candidatus Poribacteria bacterium]|nr:hypothetical protein [Candidatus Poribacteria bacterium]MEE2909528.1 phytanoyl-CoA dioxygenase family protein [Candidatus Poribacteria bacterium]